jgi:hypothetical protein
MAVREFEVTLLTIRCGRTMVSGLPRLTRTRCAGSSTWRFQPVTTSQLSEYCTDEVQTEICAIREIHS